MLDPYKISRPHLFPQPTRAWLVTRGWGRLAPVHTHIAYLDSNGNGATSISVSHFHRVVGGRILPDESDGHTHERTAIPAGSGV